MSRPSAAPSCPGSGRPGLDGRMPGDTDRCPELPPQPRPREAGRHPYRSHADERPPAELLVSRASLGERTRPRRAQTLDRCKTCGSESLWGAHFDADGLAVTDGSGDYLIVCQDCGTFHLVGESR